MKRKRLIPLGVGVIALTVLVGFWLLGTGETAEPSVAAREKAVSRESPKPATRKAKPKVAKVADSAQPVAATAAMERQQAAEDGDDNEGFTPHERKVYDAIQDALDDDDFAKVAAQLKDAAASTNVAVRAKAVQALGWFGEKALPELTMFMADENDDVRKDAIDAWTQGLSQMEAGHDKAQAVLSGLSVVTDEDQLTMMVRQVDDLTDVQRIDVLSQVIDSGNARAAQIAREHYKFWAEEDYVDRATAEKWLLERARD